MEKKIKGEEGRREGKEKRKRKKKKKYIKK